MIRPSDVPTAGSSCSDRPCATIADASSSHINALRDALRSAFCNGIFAVSAATASSSAISALESPELDNVSSTRLGCAGFYD